MLETSPEGIQEIANTLSEATNSALVQTVGNKITLYIPRKKNSKIQLPK